MKSMSADALVRLFRSKDVDGSGTLDMQEFVELVSESDMLNHRAAILQQGEDIRVERQKEEAAAAAANAQALWRMSRTRVATVAYAVEVVGSGRRVSPW
jgi:hypothetical protein